MNSTFKVVFNKARGALMVVNEATSSVQAKGTKTVIAAAVTAFLAGGTMAGDLVITNDSLPKNDVLQSETTKLVSGKGETLYIQTNGSVGQLMEDASKLKPGDGLTKFLQDISIMLGPHNGSTIITGVTGGYNLMDQESAEFVHSKTSSDLIANKLPKDFSKKLLGQFGFNGSTGGYEMSDRVGDTHIIIGSDSSNPLVLGAIGGDLMMAATETAHAIHRTGTATTDIVSGNSLSVFGGSAVLSTIGTFKPSAGTNLVSVDSTVLNITGKANVGGFAGAGLSVAARESVSQSDVLQNSHVTIDIDKKADPSKLDGIVIGGFGGGVSVATGKGQSSANVNGTTVVDIVNGEVMGVFGGGAAVSFDATVNQFGWAGKLFINTIKGSGSGTATTSSNSIIMNVGAESSTAALAGGSLALADSSENNVGSSTATVKDVVMNFNGPAKLTDDNKAKLHQAAYTYLGKLKTDITTKNFTEFVKDFSGFAGGVNVDGVHAGNLGGGIALARGYFVTDKDNGTVTAASNVDTVTMNFKGGYNVATAAGGLAVAHDKADASKAANQTNANANVDEVNLVTGANYDMGDKTSVEVTGNYEFGEILNGAATKTMTVKEGGALAVQSAQALANNFVVEEGVLALGTTARTADARDALGKYDEKAGLYLSGTVDLASAKINVGNVAADVTTNVNLGSNGTLIVDATAPHEDAAATTVTGTINAVEGSTLHYVNVADQGIVTVDVDGKVKTTVDNLLFKVVEVGDGQNKFTFERATGSDLAGTGLGGFDGDALVGMAENEVIGSLLDQANTAITSGNQREARLNGALNLAAAGGVQTAGIEAATMGIDQATKRAALTNVFLDGWTGFAEVTGTSLKMGGDSGALETKTELGGITVGGEYTMGDMTFGVMGNFGTGDVEGEGDNNGAKNDVDYYGVQGYTAKRMGQFNLVGQMGLMTTKNDVTSADGDSADIDATIFTIGARGEMAFQISKSCQAVPYVGLNYLRVATDGYNTAKGLSVDDMDQNLVSMPIGVAFSGNMDLASGWTLRPTVDVAYVHTFGDTDVEATTKFGAAAINTNLDVWSENVGRVGFGLEARKDALSFGGQIGGAFGDNDHREFYGQLIMKYLF